MKTQSHRNTVINFNTLGTLSSTLSKSEATKNAINRNKWIRENSRKRISRRERKLIKWQEKLYL